VRDERSELPDVARPRDVDDIRIEFADRLCGIVVVPPERQIVIVLLIDSEADAPAPPRDPHGGAVCLRPILRPAANGQEGESALSRVRLKLPARVRHAVDFVVGIWKERDP